MLLRIFLLWAVTVLFACSSPESTAETTSAVYPPISIPPVQHRYFDQKGVPLLAVSEAINGQTFYVDGKNGNDSWDGRSAELKGGKSGPFKTIAKALDRYSNRMRGGNTIRIKAGVYRERINVGNLQGAVDEKSRFTIGPYGDGEVVIDASDTHLLRWQPYPGNPALQQAHCDLKLGKLATEPAAVVLDDNFKASRPVYRLEDVKDFGQWYYDKATKMVYLHTRGNKPEQHDILVIKKDRDNNDYGVYLTGSYITVYGLTVRGAASYGIHSYNDFNRIENCTVKYSGKAGIKVYGKSAELLRNHVYGNVMLNWPRGNTWDTSGGWPNGMTGSSYAHIAGNIVHDNGGEGIGSMSGAGGLIIENNISYDNWSVNIYVDGQPNDTIRRNLVYCTGVNKSEAIDLDRIPKWTNAGKIYKRMRPEGIMAGDEKATTKTAQSANHKIYNNIVINCAKGFSYYGQSNGAGLRNFLVANNTIIMPRDPNMGGVWVGIDLPYNNGNNVDTVIKNNVVVGFRSDTPLVNLGGGENELGVRLDHNLYYNYAVPKETQAVMLARGKKYSFGKWQNLLKQEGNSRYGLPELMGVLTELTQGDYALKSGSPAIGKADQSLLPIVVDDFRGVKRVPASFSIGAMEHQ